MTSSGITSRILVITVAYNTSLECELFLSSLTGAASIVDVDLSIVVVNNSQDPDEISRLKYAVDSFPHVNIIHSRTNLGYFQGINLGIRSIDQNVLLDTDFIIACNNDIVFPSQFLSRLLQQKRLLESHAVISPQIISSDGRYENPHLIFPPSFFRELLYSLYYSNRLIAASLIRFQSLFGQLFRRLNTTENSKYSKPFKICQGYGALYNLTNRYIKNYTFHPEES